jgi:hypothetical protein
MKMIFRLLMALLLAGGWALAGAALHLVRTPGPIPYVGNVVLIPKDHLSYRQTYIDTRQWSEADFDAHPRIAQAVKSRAEAGEACPYCTKEAAAEQAAGTH